MQIPSGNNSEQSYCIEGIVYFHDVALPRSLELEDDGSESLTGKKRGLEECETRSRKRRRVMG